MVSDLKLLRNGIEEYAYYNNLELKEAIKPKSSQVILKVEVTDFDDVVLLRNGMKAYSYKTHLKVGGNSMVRNPLTRTAGKSASHCTSSTLTQAISIKGRLGEKVMGFITTQPSKTIKCYGV